MNTFLPTTLRRACIFAALCTSAISADTSLHAQQANADADMKVQDLRAGGDEKKRYFLIQRPTPAPATGWRTLFVLPGGPGNAEFHPFVTNITKNALPETYQVVQLVAPVWNPQQAEQNVWPMEKAAGIKFTTADFFQAVRDEVAKAHKIDPAYCFTITWSSSGINGYALPLLPKTGITGSFVAMSVFKPDTLGRLNAAKGHPYFIYHSPQDFIPLKHAETARDTLTKAGAVVQLQTYEGGHGWHGNVFAEIRKGIDWLEQQAASKTRR
jgi:predicted esterase